jgi:hypothetical protein
MNAKLVKRGMGRRVVSYLLLFPDKRYPTCVAIPIIYVYLS